MKFEWNQTMIISEENDEMPIVARIVSMFEI